MFPDSEKSTLPYWAAHNAAYNMVALNHGVWRPKYLFHDWEKPWMMIIARALKKIGVLKQDPYQWVQHWHRNHRKHHVQYYIAPGFSHDGRMPNTREMVLDWECSMLTKESSPLNAFGYYIWAKDKGKIPVGLQLPLEVELKALGLWPTDKTGAYIKEPTWREYLVLTR